MVTMFLCIISHQDSTPWWTGAAAGMDRLRPKRTPHSIVALMREGWRRWRSRRHLAELDDRTLKDIGITRADAEYELNKPFWRA